MNHTKTILLKIPLWHQRIQIRGTHVIAFTYISKSELHFSIPLSMCFTEDFTCRILDFGWNAVEFATIEWFSMECEACSVACLLTLHHDSVTQLYPRHCQNGPCICTRQGECILFIMTQQLQGYYITTNIISSYFKILI